MRKKHSIVYVTFFPYDNLGNIFGYLIEKFDIVIHFSFDPQKINKSKSVDTLRIYRNGKTVTSRRLFTVPIDSLSQSLLLFITIPFSLLLIAFHVLWNLPRIKNRYGRIDYFFTINAFLVSLGNICRFLGYVKTTVFWVCDFFPSSHPDWKVRMARTIYWYFDAWATRSSNRLYFLNKRLLKLRIKENTLPQDASYPIIPIGTNPSKRIRHKKTFRIGHLGVLKKAQGLDFLFDNLPSLTSQIPDITIEVIGAGADEAYFRKKVESEKERVRFHGFIKSEKLVAKTVDGWSIGTALYAPTKDSVSVWTDPSKAKYYLSRGVPVIITDVLDFAKEIEKYKAGKSIAFGDGKALLFAIHTILQNHSFYQKNAWELAQKYHYKKLYPRLFT